MKAVIQRVERAKLGVDGQTVSEIPAGLVVYLGVQKGDEPMAAEKTAKKIANMRIFSDADGKMNLSVADTGGEILLVSQFTLMANCSRGNRPDFFAAEAPDRANELYEYTGKCLSEYGVSVKYGVFGADMRIEQVNSGPVTIIYEEPAKLF